MVNHITTSKLTIAKDVYRIDLTLILMFSVFFCIISKKRGSHKMTTPNTQRKSKEWLFFPYLAVFKNSYPEILRR
jgi:hypothetical protein